MASEPKKIGQVIAWPEFQVAWILFAVIAAAFVIDYIVFTNTFLLLIEGGLLLIAFVLVTISIYRSAAADRDTKIERNELRSILVSLDDGLIVYDENFYAVFFNPAAERIFKTTAKNIIGHKFAPQDVERPGWKTLIQIIFPALAPRVVTRTKEGEYPQVLDVSFTDPQLEFRVTTSPVVDETGRTLAFMKIVRDRTAQLAAMRSRSEFVTIASHQLRGPVTDITWALDSLARATELSDSDKLIVQNAAGAGRGLLRRIEDLLNISKMEEGQFGYEFQDADLVDFLSKILADILPAARTAGIKVYFDRPAAALPRVNIDPKRLSLVMVNLLENAIRYNVENGEVIVKAEVIPGKPFVEVSVKDTGIGIPAESIEKIFTKFYRADNALKAQTEGSGLGLYIAKTIVNAHGGEIWVESELNRGTTVHFTLPTDLNLIPRHEIGSVEEF
ncbi:MAG TPA: ATP-binding protein [Candidatus Paceibacterota bacterium]|nr:ATP-binding protein [Candidatus Paceibacterota bacterium]